MCNLVDVAEQWNIPMVCTVQCAVCLRIWFEYAKCCVFLSGSLLCSCAAIVKEYLQKDQQICGGIVVAWACVDRRLVGWCSGDFWWFDYFPCQYVLVDRFYCIILVAWGKSLDVYLVFHLFIKKNLKLIVQKLDLLL